MEAVVMNAKLSLFNESARRYMCNHPSQTIRQTIGKIERTVLQKSNCTKISVCLLLPRLQYYSSGSNEPLRQFLMHHQRLELTRVQYMSTYPCRYYTTLVSTQLPGIYHIRAVKLRSNSH